MRPHSTKATAIALIAAASMCSVFASSVQAQSLLTRSTTPFQKAQTALEHQIIARQVQLALLGTEVADAANVTASDRTALAGIITSEQAALVTDAANAAAATTFAELNTVQQAVVQDERVYAVVTAQVGLVIGADNATVTETGYAALATELSSFVAELGSTYATDLLGDVSSYVTAATSLTTGVSAEALALTPSGYPGNESQIKTWTTQLGQVTKDLSKAKHDVEEIEAIALKIHVLHIFKPVSTTTSTTTTTTTA